MAGQQRARHPSRRASSGGPEQRRRPPPVPASPSNSAGRIGGPDWPAVAPGEQPIGRARLRARVAPPRSRPGPLRSCSTPLESARKPPARPSTTSPSDCFKVPSGARLRAVWRVGCLSGWGCLVSLLAESVESVGSVGRVCISGPILALAPTLFAAIARADISATLPTAIKLPRPRAARRLRLSPASGLRRSATRSRSRRCAPVSPRSWRCTTPPARARAPRELDAMLSAELQ